MEVVGGGGVCGGGGVRGLDLPVECSELLIINYLWCLDRVGQVGTGVCV